MIYVSIYLIIGNIIAASIISAGRTVAKKNKYPMFAVFIVCILFAIILSPIWPVLLGFAFGARKKQ